MNQDGESNMLEIRKAVQTDRILLEKMYLKDIENHQERAKAFADDLILKFKTILGFVDTNLAGSLSWDTRGGLDDGVVEIAGLGVNPAFRRKGVASALMKALIEDAAGFYEKNGYRLRVLYLFMEHGNDDGRSFYGSLAFEEVAKLPSFYPHDDGVIWLRHLNDTQ